MTILKYVKKPVEIEALQWTGGNLKDCIDFLGDSYIGHNAERHINGRSEIMIKTLEGQHVASKGDYIIKGLAGEFYPCKPLIFDASYTVVV